MLSAASPTDIDDALDSASRSGGALGASVSFLGGKGSDLGWLEELGYQLMYVRTEGVRVQGGQRPADETVLRGERQRGQLGEDGQSGGVEKMLDEKGVGFKYVRDLGMATKLEMRACVVSRFCLRLDALNLIIIFSMKVTIMSQSWCQQGNGSWD